MILKALPLVGFSPFPCFRVPGVISVHVQLLLRLDFYQRPINHILFTVTGLCFYTQKHKRKYPFMRLVHIHPDIFKQRPINRLNVITCNRSMYLETKNCPDWKYNLHK